MERGLLQALGKSFWGQLAVDDKTYECAVHNTDMDASVSYHAADDANRMSRVMMMAQMKLPASWISLQNSYVPRLGYFTPF